MLKTHLHSYLYSSTYPVQISKFLLELSLLSLNFGQRLSLLTCLLLQTRDSSYETHSHSKVHVNMMSQVMLNFCKTIFPFHQYPDETLILQQDQQLIKVILSVIRLLCVLTRLCWQHTGEQLHSHTRSVMSLYDSLNMLSVAWMRLQINYYPNIHKQF